MDVKPNPSLEATQRALRCAAANYDNRTQQA